LVQDLDIRIESKASQNPKAMVSSTSWLPQQQLFNMTFYEMQDDENNIQNLEVRKI
jgi:hypothetical protein